MRVMSQVYCTFDLNPLPPPRGTSSADKEIFLTIAASNVHRDGSVLSPSTLIAVAMISPTAPMTSEKPALMRFSPLT